MSRLMHLWTPVGEQVIVLAPGAEPVPVRELSMDATVTIRAWSPTADRWVYWVAFVCCGPPAPMPFDTPTACGCTNFAIDAPPVLHRCPACGNEGSRDFVHPCRECGRHA